MESFYAQIASPATDVVLSTRQARRQLLALRWSSPLTGCAHVYDLIARHSAMLITELQRLTDVGRYQRLLSSLRESSGAVAANAVFQKEYRNYWRMNVARLSPAFYTQYFRILAESSQSGSVDLQETSLALMRADDKQTLQFSFATKLGHMADPRLPVYDSFVASFYSYQAPSPEGPAAVRLTDLLEFYGFLRDE